MWPNGATAQRFAFRHALERDTLLDRAGETGRRLLHLRLAGSLEAGWGASASEIAGELAIRQRRDPDRGDASSRRSRRELP